MNRNLVIAMALVGMAFLLAVAGCGSKNESSSGPTLNTANLETRPISEITAEADKMSEKQLRDAAGQYKKALTAKEAEVSKMMEKFKQISPTEASGNQTKSINMEVDKMGKSVRALTERQKIYVDKLKAMKVNTTGLE